MRADIHHGPEPKLHNEAGYISARPTSPSPKASCDARPVHTFGSLADAHLGRCDVRFAQQADVLNSLLVAMSFPVCNKKFPVPIAGNSSKKASCFKGLYKWGGAFQLKFPVFSRGSGNLRIETGSLQPRSTATLSTCYTTILCLSGTGRIRGRIPRFFRVLGFGSKWRRQFRAKFRRVPLRKSLERRLGVNFPFW